MFSARQNLPTLYCDLDGVLVDFLKGADTALKLQGYPIWNDKHWSQFHIDKADTLRWDIIKKHNYFWRDLPWMPDGKKLWSVVSNFDPHILSHAVTKYMPTAKPEKFQWVSKNLGLHNIAVIHLVDNRSEKARFAINSNGKANVLIDDHDKNCREWQAAGGIAIHHTSLNDTLSKLQKVGYK